MMNENHSRDEWKYIPRWITPIFQTALADHPIVVLTGPRQVGKSTFLKYAEPTRDWQILSMDDLDVLAQAQRNPAALFVDKKHLVLDEIQKVPQLLSEIKRVVDESQRETRFVLSGSANLLLMQKVSETLAGRAVFLTLDSMTIGESQFSPPESILLNLLQSKWPDEQRLAQSSFPLSRIILRGLIAPVLQLDELSSALRWWEGYVATFLERDIRSMSRIDSLPDFRNLMAALALRSGQLLNQTEVARDIGMQQPTLHRYINLLDVMCLVQRLPAFALNRTKRLVKSPKIYWFDPGLAAFLAGYYDEESLIASREWGGFFETLIFQHLRVWSSLQTPRARLYFWRTSIGKEVDFVIERGQKLLAIEVKSNKKARYQDIDNLKLFIREYSDRAAAGILVYSGSEIKRMDERIVAIPWQFLV